MALTITAIREANEARGDCWFSKLTMRFFSCKVYPRVYLGGHFVTSEVGPDHVRRYSVRVAREDGKIDTVGEFQQYSKLDQARTAAKNAHKGES